MYISNDMSLVTAMGLFVIVFIPRPAGVISDQRYLIDVFIVYAYH